MNSNLLTALVVGAVIILGGLAFFFYGTPGGSTPSTATDTASGVTSGTTGDASSGTTGTVTTTTTSGTPTAPVVTTGAAGVVSNSNAAVTGKITPNGSPTVYWYEYDTTSAFGLHTSNQSLGSGYTSTAAPAILIGLAPNTKYLYRLKATNAYGTVTGQSLSFTTNTNTPSQVVPPVVGSDPASLVTRTTATVNGHLTPNSPPVSYWFEYGVTTDLGNTTPIKSTSASVEANLSASLANLKPYTKYYFRLNAQNQYGTVNSAVTSFMTSGPAAAEAPTVSTENATAPTASTATMHGTVTANGAATTYWFEYSTDPLLVAASNRATSHVTVSANAVQAAVQANIAGLTPSTMYYFRIVAQNNGGTVRGERASFSTN